jgi:hypothetical protein
MRLKRLLYKGLPNKGKSKQSPINPRGQYRVRKKNFKRKLLFRVKRELYINLKRLISGKSCTIPYTLFYNKY